ncbi:hypothetical protein [Paraclostridium bifermentans]|uniref:hypothetical protein n=1 Tax=Paraclostridium bifermentans TaxID=1490 RepID=UPI001C80E5E7|nr:hypothetical protein [Paraclostridium bifermentans]GIM33826.1 hypothetical protein PAGU1678_30950 [Paraclostridium bifermentans subsp. muricolitidis]
MTRDQSKVTTNNTSDNIKQKSDCTNKKKGLGLSRYTYADYVILSSTLAYAIGEELNDEDLTLFIVFLGQISADLSLIRTKRGLLPVNLAGTQEEEDIILAGETEQTIEDVTSAELTRSKKRKVKKRKIKKKKTI